jgi:hypothetical protein
MVDAYNFIGIHFTQLQEFNQAYDAFDSAIELAPDHEFALDKERDVRTMLEKRSNKGGGRGSVSSSQYQAQQKQMRALQKRLEQLVMVHRQLLRKYAQVSDFFDDSILPRS